VDTPALPPVDQRSGNSPHPHVGHVISHGPKLKRNTEIRIILTLIIQV
jgi:hypothetical protein